MNKATFLFSWRESVLCIFLLSVTALGQSGGKGPKGVRISIEPRNARLMVGEQVRFSAHVTTKQGEPVDAEVEWRVKAHPFQVGTITHEGLFTATAKGSGHVFAVAEGVQARAHVVVRDTVKINQGRHLIVVPGDTSVMVNEQVRFSAFIVDSLGTVLSQVMPVWQTVGRDVGTINEDGLFTAVTRGVGLVKARYANRNAMAKVFVETEQDTSENDAVNMNFQNLAGETIGRIHRLGEREVLKISGLPFPLNVLNGGELVFPAGSLTEDISISVRLTDFADQLNDSTLTFTQGVLAGVHFKVMVDDSVISPYYFADPVLLSLPYKEDLMDSLGVTPDDLWVFFYSDSTGFEDGGITNVVVDSAAGRIYADIIHFSEIVISYRGRSTAAVVRDRGQTSPRQFDLIGNFPNPFNPETRISFTFNGAKPRHIRMVIYNLIGQKIRTVYNGFVENGKHTMIWDARDDAGRAVSSGVYIVRLEGPQTAQSHKMLLIR